jgi:hypothetical protein
LANNWRENFFFKFTASIEERKKWITTQHESAIVMIWKRIF